ncbi:hypothetical protein [Falsigemmobacter intermedius]|uniref:hypothetical protein n=1 Tax=Falsigemmobacter intermedius TaxID=1553448 RepID=UPI003F0BA157
MNFNKTGSLLLAAFVGLAGCAPISPVGGVRGHLSPLSSEAVHSFRFAPGATQLSGAEISRLRRFVNPTALTRQDRIIVSVPKASTPRQDAQRRAHLRGLFNGSPAAVELVADNDLADPARGETVGIVRLLRVRGVKVTCTEGETSDGCANASNLAAMLVEPVDLYLPAGPGVIRTRREKSAAETAAAASAASDRRMGGERHE